MLIVAMSIWITTYKELSMSNMSMKEEKSKFVDQMLEDIAGDEYDDFDESYEDFGHSHKHYLADEEAILDIDELY